MKVFMSWSGQRSKLTAELLYEWIKCVIQAAQPWISSKGIERGAMWFSEINNQLADTTVGIICITQENKNAPWILFEAGALAKGLSSNRVCTFLIDLEPADLQPPLAQFNHTFPNRDSMWNLVDTLNNGLEANRLEPTVLERVFNTYWPQFEVAFKGIIEQSPPTTPAEPRDQNDILAEILESTRSLSKRMRSLESRNNMLNHVSGVGKSHTMIHRGALDPLNKSVLIDIAQMHMTENKSPAEVEAMLMHTNNLSPELADEIVQIAMSRMFPISSKSS